MRREGERWISEIVQGRDAKLSLASVGLTVAMADLYDGIELRTAAAAADNGRRLT
jgi:hypothetical protein